MKSKYQIILPNQLILEIEALAKRNKVSINKIIVEICKEYLKFDDSFFRFLAWYYGLAESKLSVPEILQRLAILTLAERDARLEVYGREELLKEAADDGLTLIQFYDLWKNNEIKRLERKRELQESQTKELFEKQKPRKGPISPVEQAMIDKIMEESKDGKPPIPGFWEGQEPPEDYKKLRWKSEEPEKPPE